MRLTAKAPRLRGQLTSNVRRRQNKHLRQSSGRRIQNSVPRTFGGSRHMTVLSNGYRALFGCQRPEASNNQMNRAFRSLRGERSTSIWTERFGHSSRHLQWMKRKVSFEFIALTRCWSYPRSTRPPLPHGGTFGNVSLVQATKCDA